MIPDWQTRKVWFSSLFPKRYPRIWAEVSASLKNHGIPIHLLPGTRDVWVRDFLPVAVSPERFVKFRYRPDYLRGYPRMRTGERIIDRLPFRERIIVSPIVLDGGNVVASSRRVILTDKVYRENPAIEPVQLRQRLSEWLGGAELIVIPQEPGDPIGHADGVVRFLDEDAVVVNDYRRVDPKYYAALEDQLKGAGLRIERIPYSIDEKSIRGDLPSAAGNYVNFMRVENLVLLPSYGINSDAQAATVLRQALPAVKIVPIQSWELARQGGVLNCVTWNEC